MINRLLQAFFHSKYLHTIVFHRRRLYSILYIYIHIYYIYYINKYINKLYKWLREISPVLRDHCALNMVWIDFVAEHITIWCMYIYVYIYMFIYIYIHIYYLTSENWFMNLPWITRKLQPDFIKVRWPWDQIRIIYCEPVQCVEIRRCLCNRREFTKRTCIFLFRLVQTLKKVQTVWSITPMVQYLISNIAWIG